MVFYRITLIRSTIGLPQSTKKIVSALGLGKRGSVVYKRVTPVIAGAVTSIKELVDVEVSKGYLSAEQIHQQRKSNPGYKVTGRAF
ncbi:probable 54S ribosomal protein L33, mitochondrial [Saccharomycodes ludwigii]|uniref:Large ribosomal subunit protein uL30m n=1 Tax=Saccharomycodes ludwigii TaxID=36035 RepID=A0A376B517_9ASCO|nr:hypothetical protein SCDLUD_001256 [Saccharomycodes ludwigii]KAH3903612.1 hypothetical protein SCDLUD_001256 [Saccharomycodes ludwigii]SSD59787.1 probable 54S ribosomal protein L33, mitochondrial [Saccharomycodes ludwigii]